MDERVLENLTPFLKQIVLKRVEDVRTLFKNFREKVEVALDDGKQVPSFSSLDLIDL
jgi:hypothetical protein